MLEVDVGGWDIVLIQEQCYSNGSMYVYMIMYIALPFSAPIIIIRVNPIVKDMNHQ